MAGPAKIREEAAAGEPSSVEVEACDRSEAVDSRRPALVDEGERERDVVGEVEPLGEETSLLCESDE